MLDTELDVFESDPNFEENYYRDHEALYKKWKSEMGEDG